MGKQPKTGVYQYNAFGEMDAAKELRELIQHLTSQQLFYDRYWSDEKRAEVKTKIDEAKATLQLLK